ncbi:hypothetical protein A2239_02280 [Candidatus Uhrbacteria bacterium RIFOXYA2_FULL_40_9]|nr:MAG: hypothetical protein A2239_02280 [Candidatus Uhrbacteria bacterium RIFOXYA2_FULL_40_9]OGL97876.1 MAG: hypothetical protein A2332_01790 [Candidatus Uhrbacteria bacterium RIFOXYB2_FULL_41_18]HBK34820.1 excinuclease ABC subunit C [Candidatus Uhrbacteria bacterium]HCB55672.1 excinuclease ABC subunit C [Candidatus Uhrbacteria bacterium]
MYCVYLLKSIKDQGYYIGYTADLKHRVQDHQSGFVASTRNRTPLQLIYFEAYSCEMSARQREKQLKHFGSAYSALLKRLGLK